MAPKPSTLATCGMEPFVRNHSPSSDWEYDLLGTPLLHSVTSLVSGQSHKSFERVLSGFATPDEDEDKIVWPVSSETILSSQVTADSPHKRDTKADDRRRSNGSAWRESAVSVPPSDGDLVVVPRERTPTDRADVHTSPTPDGVIEAQSHGTWSEEVERQETSERSSENSAGDVVDIPVSSLAALRLDNSRSSHPDKAHRSGSARQRRARRRKAAGCGPTDSVLKPDTASVCLPNSATSGETRSLPSPIVKSKHCSYANEGKPVSNVVLTDTLSRKGQHNFTKRKKDVSTTKAQAKASDSKPNTSSAGLGQRPVVDDVSENGDGLETTKENLLSAAYDEAVKFMNSFITNPSYYTSKASRLTFLQALILELGLCEEYALPGTLTSARTLLRTRAFLNVRDYLAVRAEGVDALRRAMRPSRGALVRDLRGTRRRAEGESVEGGREMRAPLGWVKETGLTVLLVSM